MPDTRELRFPMRLLANATACPHCKAALIVKAEKAGPDASLSADCPACGKPIRISLRPES